MTKYKTHKPRQVELISIDPWPDGQKYIKFALMISIQISFYLGYGDFKTYKLPTYATERTKHEIMPLKRVIVLKLTKGPMWSVKSAMLFISTSYC